MMTTQAQADTMNAANHDALLRRLDEAKAQNARLVALFNDDTMPMTWPGSYCTYPLTDECAWVPARLEQCYQHRRRSLLAEIGKAR